VPRAIAGMTADEFVDTIRGGYPKPRLKLRKLRALHNAAQTSIGIQSGTKSLSIELSLLAQRLRLGGQQIEEVEERLVGLVDSMKDGEYLLSVRGLSYVTVAGLLAELGPLRSYQNAKQLIKMAGSNPIESESAGKRRSRTPMSKKGRPGLRWCIWTAAISLLRHNSDFRSWARMRRERPAYDHPLKAREVVGAAGNRLLRLAYALIKKQTSYRMPQMAEVAS